MLGEDIKEVMLGVLANALTSLLAQIGRKAGKLLESQDEKDSTLVSTLRKALETTSEEIEWEGSPDMEEVCLFLTSPEAESLVRQIYSCKIAGQKEDKSLPLIRKEFDVTLAKWTGTEVKKLSHAGEVLFTAILKGCEESLRVAIEKGELSSHEGMSAFRFRILKDEIAGIKKNLEFLTKEKILDVKDILKFEEKYRQQVSQRHAYIVPPNFDTVRKVSIDNLYVCPRFHTIPKSRREESKIISNEEFLTRIYRVVLLGDPGGGKSTFATKLCHDLATSSDKRIIAGRNLTPILVTLRDYGAEKKTLRSSILRFIQTMASSKYQLTAPEGSFEYLLLNGRAIVIFDGLDELLDTSYRQEISADIESFCSLYPAVPVIVTSRKIGYEQAPLDEKEYEVFYLAAFDEEQVVKYVENWFGLDDDLSIEQKKEKVKSFCDESKVVPDLRTNPLMLALMCNIYRGENYIPRNRPDLYEKCAMMLFERWDKSRGIHVTLPFEAHIRPAIMHVAHWIYGNEKLQGGVSENNLIQETTNYLCDRRFEDEDEAVSAAREFIIFCRGRAWVFTDTGTTKQGERLYQFTHRTFLEYFSASYLVRTHATPKSLGDALVPKISKREWDVVAQLSCQIQNRNIEGAGDNLLQMFVQAGQRAKNLSVSINLLTFAGRCLEFMVPSPKVTRDVTIACVEKHIDKHCELARKKEKGNSRHDFHFGENIGYLLRGILTSAQENRETVKKTIEKKLWDAIESSDEWRSLVSLEVGIRLHMVLLFVGIEEQPNTEPIEFWQKFSQEFRDICNTKEHLKRKSQLLCMDLVYDNKINIAEMIKWHGTQSLFNTYRSVGFSGFLTGPFAEWISMNLFESSLILGDLGRIMIDWSTPWVDKKEVCSIDIEWFARRWEANKDTLNKIPEFNGDSLFGLFGLFSVLLEARHEEKSFDKLVKFLIETKTPYLNKLAWVWIGRQKGIDKDKANAEGIACGFSEAQISFITAWIRKEIALIGKKESRA